MRGFLTEGGSQFFKVDLLARSFFISEHVGFNSEAVILVGFEENEAIIGKEEVGNSGTASGHFDTLQDILASFEIEDGRKTLRAQHKEVMGQGVPLLEAPQRDNLSNNASIQLEGVCNGGDTLHDVVNPSSVKAQCSKGGLEVGPLHSILCFAHV